MHAQTFFKPLWCGLSCFCPKQSKCTQSSDSIYFKNKGKKLALKWKSWKLKDVPAASHLLKFFSLCSTSSSPTFLSALPFLHFLWATQYRFLFFFFFFSALLYSAGCGTILSGTAVFMKWIMDYNLLSSFHIIGFWLQVVSLLNI